jgi:hypothetical protein
MPLSTEVPDTPAIAALKAEQLLAREHMYDVWTSNPDQLAEAKKQYDATVGQLVALYCEAGITPAVWHIDIDLASHYSDWHRDVVGFRPRGFITREGVLEWIERETAAAKAQPEPEPEASFVLPPPPRNLSLAEQLKAKLGLTA